MSVSMEAVRESVERGPRKSAGERRRKDAGPMMSGDDLMREIRRAMRAVPGARTLSEHESDAVAQAVAVSILTRRARSLPRDLREYAATAADRGDVAGIGRALRVDAARREREPGGIARGEVGRTMLAARVRATMAQRADWQDTASTFRTRAEALKGERRMVVPLPESADAPHPAGLLARSLPVDPLRVDPVDVPALAAGVAEVLAGDAGAVAVRRVLARLRQSLAVANGMDAAQALASLAAEDGRTLNAVRIDAARGADLLAAADLSPADLAAVVRDTARRMGLARASTWDRLSLSREAHAAGEAVARLARIGGAWDAGSIHTGRSLPDREPRTSEPRDVAPFPAVCAPGCSLPVKRPARPCGESVPVLPVPVREPMPAPMADAVWSRCADAADLRDRIARAVASIGAPVRILP